MRAHLGPAQGRDGLRGLTPLGQLAEHLGGHADDGGDRLSNTSLVAVVGRLMPLTLWTYWRAGVRKSNNTRWR
jgi:hypothetical protein